VWKTRFVLSPCIVRSSIKYENWNRNQNRDFRRRWDHREIATMATKTIHRCGSETEEWDIKSIEHSHRYAGTLRIPTTSPYPLITTHFVPIHYPSYQNHNLIGNRIPPQEVHIRNHHQSSHLTSLHLSNSPLSPPHTMNHTPTLLHRKHSHQLTPSPDNVYLVTRPPPHKFRVNPRIQNIQRPTLMRIQRRMPLANRRVGFDARIDDVGDVG
jgi:hypothetical protein